LIQSNSDSGIPTENFYLSVHKAEDDYNQTLHPRGKYVRAFGGADLVDRIIAITLSVYVTEEVDLYIC
jgi:hypothetical protein